MFLNRIQHKQGDRIKVPLNVSGICCAFSQVRLFATPWTVAHQAPLSVHGILQARILEWVAISFSVHGLNTS